MGPSFLAFGWVVVGLAFVPTFIAGVFILRSLARAFVLSAGFTLGAFAGFAGSGFLGAWLMRSRSMDPDSTTVLICFATAGAIGGAILALYLLGRFAKNPPWRRG